MKSKLLMLCFLAMLCALGCSSTISTNPSDYVGEYVFEPVNAPPGDFASFMILKKDQTALEIRFAKETGQVKISEGRWYLDRGTSEDIVIDKRAYPIHRSHSTIRLTVNEVGQYYEKFR
jgi:hypothetical protein